MMLTLMSVVCWKNSKFVITKDNNKEIFKCADEKKNNKGKTNYDKESKEKQL